MKYLKAILFAIIIICLCCCKSTLSDISGSGPLLTNNPQVFSLTEAELGWIYNKDVIIKISKFELTEKNEVVYVKRFSEKSDVYKDLIFYYLPVSKNSTLTNKHLEVMAYSYNFRRNIPGTKKENYSIHWINCPLVCNDDYMKKTITKLWNMKKTRN